MKKDLFDRDFFCSCGQVQKKRQYVFGILSFNIRCDSLWTQTATALQSDSLARNVRGIVRGEEYSYTTNILLGVGKASERNTLYGLLE